MALLCASCHPEKAEEKVSAVQLEEGRVPWDTLARHLRITGLIPVVSDSLFLAHCDKAVIRGTEVYLLDAVQQALFRTDTRTGRLRPLLHALGRSRAEYLSVTDFDVDPSGRLLVYDSDSRKVNRYSPSGRYLGSLPVRPGTALAAAPGGQLALHTNRLVQDTLVIAYDSTGTPCASAPAWGEEPVPTVCRPMISVSISGFSPSLALINTEKPPSISSRMGISLLTWSLPFMPSLAVQPPAVTTTFL